MVVILNDRRPWGSICVWLHRAGVIRAWRLVGIGAYAAGIIQKHWPHDAIVIPLLLSMLVVAGCRPRGHRHPAAGRGLFLVADAGAAALTYTVAFRWTEVTGGEDGRVPDARRQYRTVQPRQWAYLLRAVALIGSSCFYVLLRVVARRSASAGWRSARNQLRATFQGYAVEHYKLGVSLFRPW